MLWANTEEAKVLEQNYFFAPVLLETIRTGK